MSRIVDYLVASHDAVQAAIGDPAFVATTEQIVDRLCGSLTRGGKILLAGNGGSAGDAQHLAGELVGRLNYDRGPVAAVALTTDSSVLTAIGNDYGYEYVFERQIRGLGRAGDVLIAMSTSGHSSNILRGIDAARSLGLAVVGLTGRAGGEMRARCDICLCAPADTASLIQQIHIMVGHAVCGAIEERLFPRPARMSCSPTLSDDRVP